VVLLQPGRHVVRDAAVELNSDALVEPRRIYQPPSHTDVHGRWGKGVSFAEQDEPLFQEALGPGELRAVAVERDT
jgi:hypothetical protein